MRIQDGLSSEPETRVSRGKVLRATGLDPREKQALGSIWLGSLGDMEAKTQIGFKVQGRGYSFQE